VLRTYKRHNSADLEILAISEVVNYALKGLYSPSPNISGNVNTYNAETYVIIYFMVGCETGDLSMKTNHDRLDNEGRRTLWGFLAANVRWTMNNCALDGHRIYAAIVVGTSIGVLSSIVLMFV
jgi:hypothetical protein